MTVESRNPAIRIVIIGLGTQGTEIARLALDLGYEVLGAVDVDQKVGRPISEFVHHASAADTPVYGSVEELLGASATPDVAIVSALVAPETTAELARGLLLRGINVVTLEAVLFDGSSALVAALDSAGKTGNATMTASGMQDLWWVHLPAMAASACHRLRRVLLDDFGNCSRFPREVGVYEAALGLDLDDFEEWSAPHLAAPPIQGGPMLSLAHALGLKPSAVTASIEPITQEEPADWFGADIQIPPGKIVGVRYLAEFQTEEGVGFVGCLRFQVQDETHPALNRIVITGDTELTIEMPEFATPLYVPIGAVRRIPDVIAAPAGFVPVADLPAPNYQTPVV